MIDDDDIYMGVQVGQVWYNAHRNYYWLITNLSLTRASAQTCDFKGNILPEDPSPYGQPYIIYPLYKYVTTNWTLCSSVNNTSIYIGS